MRSHARRALHILLAIALVWAVDNLCVQFQTSRATAGMMLLLVVLGIATRGDWWLAIATVCNAALAFGYYHIDDRYSLAITTTDGAVTFGTMVVTTIVGSQLAVRARRRADEAERRRSDVEKLQNLGSGLLTPAGVSEVGQAIVTRVVELFGVDGALLRLDREEIRAGNQSSETGVELRIRGGQRPAVLTLYGPALSAEVRNSIANLAGLALDRARASQERAYMESVQRGEQLRNTVLNALAHNFKTPLTCIKAASSILRNSESLQGGERDLAVAIDEEADRLARLIGESLDLARIEAHRMNPRREDCDLRAILARILERMMRQGGARKLIFEMPEHMPVVRGDNFLLEQMFSQVIDNAWKYSRPNASIAVRASITTGRIVTTIQNEGNRIPEAERDRIFERLVRGSGNPAVEGSGLGLPIARSIAEVHGGALWLDQDPAGPAFRFILPTEPASNENSDERDGEAQRDSEPNYSHH